MECKNYCERKTNKTLKKNAMQMKKIPTKSQLNLQYKKSLKKCKTEEEKENAKKIYDGHLKNISLMKSILKLKKKKFSNDLCKIEYCNEGCKKTMYEDEPGTEFENHMKKKEPKFVDSFMLARKRLFNGKKSIIKDNFNEKINASKVKQMKKEGAISGCVHERKINKGEDETSCSIQ